MAGVFLKNKRKISEENRIFQSNWEKQCFIVPNKNGSAYCLICGKSVILKNYYIVRHYITKHKSFDNIYSPGSLMIHEKLNFFNKSLNHKKVSYQ